MILSSGGQSILTRTSRASGIFPAPIIANSQLRSSSSKGPNPNTPQRPPTTDGPSDHDSYKRKRSSTGTPSVPTTHTSDNIWTDSISKRRRRLTTSEPALLTTIDGLPHDGLYTDSPNDISPALVTVDSGFNSSLSKESLYRKYKLAVVEVTPNKPSKRGWVIQKEVIQRGKWLHRGRLFRSDKWKDCGKIGSGAFGTVFLQKKRTGSVRAVKRLAKDILREPERELINLILVIDRPDLFVQFHGWYENRDFVFYVMEYLGYGDLGKHMEKYPEEVKKDAKEISRQVLEALDILHERRICHRDLKPQNILIASLSPIHVKLADFGISKHEVDSIMKTTRMGTPGYIAPEVLGLLPKGSPLGCRQYTNAVDMWSLGCLVHTMLTGQQPFSSYGSFDMSILVSFCNGQTELTNSILDAHVKNLHALDFIQKLLVQDGSQRMSASEALDHRWITSGKFRSRSKPLSAVDTPSTDSPQPHCSSRPRWGGFRTWRGNMQQEGSANQAK